MSNVSQVHYSFDAAQLKATGAWKLNKHYSMDEYDRVMGVLGIGISRGAMQTMKQVYAMDTIQQPLTTPSVTTPVQFLQNWLPGIVEIVTAARKLDEIIGISTIGSWSDEQIVQQVIEQTGAPAPYGDTTNVPFAEWNQNFVTRTVVRFEQGMRNGVLEQERAARVRVSSDEQKRKSAAIQLEIARNQIGFYGYNGGDNLTYGFLTDPNLPNYVSAPNGSWETATFLEIQQDVLTALQALRTNSKDLIDPGKTPIVLTIATAKRDYLSTTSDFGISVMEWLNEAYPNVRVESAPQLTGANGGADVFYAHAERVEDGVSSDDMATFLQVVPARFQMLGVAQMAKGYEEDYANATAGVLCKRPYAVVRYTGI